MEAKCPRCGFENGNVDADLLASGLCTECAGQLYFVTEQAVQANGEGALAATFEIGSGIATPVRGEFLENRIALRDAPPPPPPVDEGDEHSDGGEIGGDEAPPPPPGDATAAGDGELDAPGLEPDPSLNEEHEEHNAAEDSSPVAAEPGAESASESVEESTEEGEAPGAPPPGLEDLAAGDGDGSQGETPEGETEASEPSSEVAADDAENAAETSGLSTAEDAAESETEGAPENGDLSAGSENEEAAGDDIAGSESEEAEDDEPGFDAGPLADSTSEAGVSEGSEFPSEDPSEDPSTGAEDAPVGEGGGESGEAEPVAAKESSSELPAHLQLPAIDFSLPAASAGDAEHASSGTAAAGDTSPDGAGGAMPAHLDLPNFPQFDLPPVPGDEGAANSERRISDGTEVEGLSDGGGSFAADDDSSDPADRVAAAASGQPNGEWKVGTPAQVVVPPRPPPPRAKKKPAESEAALGALPSLPAIAKAPEPKRDPTLVSQVPESLQSGGSGKLVGLTLVVLLLLAGIGAAFWKRNVLIAMFAEPAAAKVEKSAAVKALELWGEGKKAYDAKNFQAAIEKATEATRVDPSLGKAHRLLGIVFAAQQKPGEAVDHYRKYLSLTPDAPDAAKLNEIIQAYEASQKKK